jgi:preprotein translocase subunit SecB
MSDQTRLPGEDFAPKPPSGEFQFLKIYTKDVSFETPNTPQVFGMDWAPSTDVNLRTDVQQLNAGDFEVTLAVTAEAKLGERTAFLAEVQQAGIFKIIGLTREELAPVLGAYCPSMLFPYVREVISDLVARGGFPPFLLAPVNFDAIYAQRQRDGQSTTAGDADTVQEPPGAS